MDRGWNASPDDARQCRADATGRCARAHVPRVGTTHRGHRLDLHGGRSAVVPGDRGGRSNPTGLVPSTETGAPLGYVVQRRLVGNTAATTKLLTELIGSGAKLYIGNARGDIWTDLVAVTPSPRIDAAGINGLRGVLQYERIPGQQVLAAINEIPNTPWAIAVEFPRSLALQSSHEMLWRLAFII